MRIRWILCLLFLPCLAVAAVVPPEVTRTPVPKSGGFNGDRMRDAREGGESWADAVVIPSLPYTDSGATCDNADDITLPCASSQAPDVVYRYTAPADQAVNVSLCGSGYDTALGIYDAGHNNLACNDDYCGLQSEIDNFQLQAGQTYYFVIDGYSTSCGSYELNVSVTPPCVVECPAGAQQEGEPPCVDGYYDVYNGGCQTMGWTLIQPQDGDCGTMCSRSCTYLYQGVSYRDTDWYVVTGSGGPMTVTAAAEFPIQLIIFYTADCYLHDYILGTGAPCEPVTLSWNLDSGQECWIWAGPTVFNGVQDSDYTLEVCGIQPTIAGACCSSWGCFVGTEADCEMYPSGVWLGPGTDCDPDPCGSDPPGACCFAGGTCDLLTESACADAQGVWQGAGTDCDPNPCVPTPVENTTWGRIKNAYH